MPLSLDFSEEYNMPKNVYIRPVASLSEKERRDEILTLELERERLNREIEELCREYARALDSREPIRRARRVGTQPNDYSYWHKNTKR